MIDARELRIGNLVNHNYGISRVNMIRGNDIGLYDSGLAICGTTVDQIEGIPLTEDILLKAGFKQHLSVFYINFECKIIIGYWPIDGTIKIGDAFAPKDIKHLHQLQNLYFALTGTELNIQL